MSMKWRGGKWNDSPMPPVISEQCQLALEKHMEEERERKQYELEERQEEAARLGDLGFDILSEKGDKQWRARQVIITYHNQWDAHAASKNWDKSRVRYVRGQREGPNPDHWQIFAQFKGQVTSYAQVQLLLGLDERAIVFIAHGKPAIVNDYCSKSKENIKSLRGGKWKTHKPRMDDKPENQITWGEISLAGPSGSGSKRSDLQEIRDLLRGGESLWAIANMNFTLWTQYRRSLEKFHQMCMRRRIPDKRNVSVRVYYGDTGCGKSHRALEWSKEHYGPDRYYKPIITDDGKWWFDGYASEPVLIIEEFYGGKCRFNALQRNLDIYKMQVQVKGGTVWARWEAIIITSNQHPRYWWNGYDKIPDAVQRSFMRRLATGGIHFIPARQDEEKSPEPLTWDSITQTAGSDALGVSGPTNLQTQERRSFDAKQMEEFIEKREREDNK